MEQPKQTIKKSSISGFLRKTYLWLNHFYLRYLYKRDTILASASVFVVIGLLALIPINSSILNPFKTALKDLDFNDIAYSVLNKNAGTPLDKRIIIVNIGNADRLGIATIIEKIRLSNPKVIGLDVQFDGPKDPLQDSLLLKVITSTQNLVLVSRIDWKNINDPEQIGYFGKYTSSRGYANFIGEDGGTIRNFSPFEKINGKEYQSLSAAIIAKADSVAYLKLLQRHKDYEVINYSRKPEQYMLIDGGAVLENNTDPELFKDHIVLIGYINPDPFNVEDKHFTPMNPKFAGKSIPDMNGIIVHANIISMILDGKYIRDVPTWLFWIITMIICWLHVALFMRYYIEDHLWFHLVAKIAQIFFAILSVYIGILCFDWFSLKIDTKVSLIVIILAIDVIYFYEALAVWLHQKFGFKTIFHSKTH